jgi:sigma-B regulation protein RsbU (phosphoserine phosphatase)
MVFGCGRAVSQQPFFKDVPHGTLEPLIALCRHLELQPGEVLLEPGRDNRHLFLLLDGLLRVRIDKADAREGYLIAPGQCVGEISIVDEKPTTAYVVAAERSHILAIPDKVLWENFLPIPTIARNFMRLFAARFRERTRAMQEALEQKLRWEHVQRELMIARDIQVGMLPAAEALARLFPAVDLSARMTAAAEVGGDFYDAFPLDNRQICLAIGDVSGKGVAASLFMARIVSLLRAEMLRHGDPCATVRLLNATLCSDNPRCMLATLIVGVFDIERRSFSYVNAGHPKPLFGLKGTSFDFMDLPTGLIVGVEDGADYEVTVQQMAPGDVLVLYSDGVTEAMNKEHEQFSDRRLQTLLSTTGSKGAREIIDVIESAIRTHAAGCDQSDDWTLLVLRIPT